jgi:hypothetical protein
MFAQRDRRSPGLDPEPIKSASTRRAVRVVLVIAALVATTLFSVIWYRTGSPGTGNATDHSSGSTIEPEPPVLPALPTGFPDGTNTGYKNAPGYNPAIGLRSNCPSGADVQPNTIYRFCDYPNGLTIGDADHHPENVTFYGSRFASNEVQDANVRTFGENTTFRYSSFVPSRKAQPPVAFGEGYQYGVSIFGGVKLTVDHCEFWGFGNAIAFDKSNQSQPVIITNNWIHDASGNTNDPATQYHTDGILSNDGGPGVTHVVIDHNTIVSEGITNGIALQYVADAYNHITVTNNYLSGFGITVDIGGTGAARNTNITFIGNVWGSDIKPNFYPIYNAATWAPNGRNNNVWKNNRIAVKPGTAWMAAGNDGLYWWPTDSNPTSRSEIVGHTTDYSGP